MVDVLLIYMPLMSSVNTVTGDANFSMEKSALTVGGFTQPSVARNLWDQQASKHREGDSSEVPL